MKPFDRISYFLYNHIGAIVFAVLFLGIVGGVSCSFFFNNKTCDFALAVVNSYADKSDMEMSDDLTSFFGLDGKKHYAYVDTGYQISYQWEDETVENTAADESFSEKFFLNISHGAMDAAIIPESYYEYCNSIEDIFYDIEYLFSKEEVAAMKPRLVKGSGDFAEYYRGIRVDDCEYLKKTGITFIDANKDDAYILVFPIGSGHKNNIKKFMETEIGILE